MRSVEEEIRIVANRMKAKIPIGPPLHQINKLIETLEERRRSQPKFSAERMKWWQTNYDRLLAAKRRLTTPEADG